MTTFVVVKDKFADTYAAQIAGEANVKAIKKAAKELIVSTVCCDDDSELMLVGIVSASDAGEARIKPEEKDGNGGITWLYWFNADGTYWDQA